MEKGVVPNLVFRQSIVPRVLQSRVIPYLLVRQVIALHDIDK
jgi:hypothetical protein